MIRYFDWNNLAWAVAFFLAAAVIAGTTNDAATTRSYNDCTVKAAKPELCRR